MTIINIIANTKQISKEGAHKKGRSEMELKKDRGEVYLKWQNK